MNEIETQDIDLGSPGAEVECRPRDQPEAPGRLLG